jgi:NAD(P)-dependent dehydrogenase (short-subunit alcohol dehydrogenase family)
MIILVTGATAGFGLAIARRFASQGGRIIAAGRRAERLEALQAELGEAVLPLTLDVRDRAAVEAAIAEYQDWQGAALGRDLREGDLVGYGDADRAAEAASRPWHACFCSGWLESIAHEDRRRCRVLLTPRACCGSPSDRARAPC